MILGIGVDLVHVPALGSQVDQPGSRFDRAFTPGERRDVNDRPSGVARSHAWAARWAAKEAVLKAWSDCIHGEPPLMGDEALAQVELVTDAWGRPRVRLHGEVADHLHGCSVQISLSHDGDYALAYVVLHRP